MTSIKEILNTELELRKAKNTSYSLRAFAYALGIDPSLLSRVLNGKSKLNRKSLEKIIPQLTLPDFEKEKLLTQDLEARNQKKELYKKGRETFFKPATQDEWPFKSQTELSIFVALTSPVFNSDLSQLQTLLNLDSSAIEKTIAELLRRNILVKTKDGYAQFAKQVADDPINTSSKTAEHKRNLQKEFLLQALSHLEKTPIEHRLNGTLTFSLDSELTNVAKQKVDGFFKELNAWAMSESKKMDSVYNCTIALYPALIQKKD